LFTVLQLFSVVSHLPVHSSSSRNHFYVFCHYVEYFQYKQKNSTRVSTKTTVFCSLRNTVCSVTVFSLTVHSVCLSVCFFSSFSMFVFFFCTLRLRRYIKHAPLWRKRFHETGCNDAGKRTCIGEQLARQEIFLFLVSLLQNFYFKPPEGQDSIDVHEEWGLTVVPSDYNVRMIVRDA